MEKDIVDVKNVWIIYAYGKKQIKNNSSNIKNLMNIAG